jgi:hypothetical protein
MAPLERLEPCSGSDLMLAVTMVMAISPRNAHRSCALARPLSKKEVMAITKSAFNHRTIGGIRPLWRAYVSIGCCTIRA